jgi:hypothetical protein
LVAGVGEFFVTGAGSLIGTKRVSLLFVPRGLIDRAIDSIRNMKSSASMVSLLCPTFTVGKGFEGDPLKLIVLRNHRTPIRKVQDHIERHQQPN